ncbi:MAG: RidA family protein [Acidimicrobiales bacterium]
MTDLIEKRIAELGYTLYGPHPPHHPLVPVVVHGGVARTSGQLPRIDGRLTCTGLLGDSVTVEQASRASEVCVLNALAVLREELGSLDRIERVLTVLGFAAVAPGTQMQPAALDGASKLLFEVFGEAGRHTRSAIGVASLPRGGTVELEVAVSLH